ncbi:hypothetical protein [Mycobacterium marseillense]|uniref:Amino acid permease n=1 Tax=Mycobacterium marseillense TaxID=701042 RepID=A0ABN5ZSM9_9MYCO|nr:hypothetical protein [Mycobacterium marseillense]MCV7404437.1 hypothetical protein [Mycobacterium marseillense]ORA86484.1 hypothetical protein BST31_23025 [Mycobacterium marseillense]BBY11620.1 hypothetical protein MMARJ_23600 [Mycobacterium marseillense]
MPKKSLRPQAQPESGTQGPLLGTWQGAGLSMAVIASAAAYGLGAVFGAAVVIPVIYALTRLRAYAPDARSTAELIGAALGPRAGFAAGAIQLFAYLALAAKFAITLGVLVLMDFSSGTDPATVVSWLPVGALAAAAAVGAVVCWVSTRAVASVVALLVVAGLLVYVYLAVAVTARVAAGSDAVVIGTAATPSQLSGQLVGFGLGMVGIELVTVRNARIAAPGRSMSLAVAVVTGAAVALWVGDHQGVAGPWRWSAKFLSEAVPEFYADAGRTWMAVAGIAMAAAAAVASGWAVVRVAAGLAVAREATPNAGLRLAGAGLLAVMAGVLSAPGLRGIATVLFGAAALLLVVLYVFVTEANSRIPDDSVVAWWVRLIVPALAVVAVVKPIVDAHFAAVEVATVVAAMLGVCAAVAAAALSKGPRIPGEI